MVIADRRQIFDCIEKSANPLIIVSQSCEEDAIGGSLALFLALKKLGKHPRIVYAGIVPDKFLFLPDSGAIENRIEREKVYQLSFAAGENKIRDISYEQDGGKFNIYFKAEAGAINGESLRICSKFNYDLILTVAACDLESLGETYSLNKELFSSLEIINIDNSEANSRFGAINAVDIYYPTVSEVAAEIVQTILPLGYGEKIATALMAGLIAETNNFQSSVIKPETFALAGALLASGAQRAEIIRHFYGIDFTTRDPKNNIDSREIKKESINEVIRMIAAPPNNMASAPVLADLANISSIKNFYQPVISEIEAWDPEYAIQRLLMNLRRSYFWIFLGLVLAIIIIGAGSLNNIFLSMNKLRVETEIAAKSVSGKITQNVFGFFLPSKINFDPKSPGKEIIYSASKVKKINIGLPIKLSIPRLGLESQILQVNLDKSGTMETPSNYKDVGWFKLGVRPGEVGNAVIAGHLDSANSTDGVFRRLNELVVGDDVYVADSEKNKLHFRVVSSRVYEAKNAPMQEIFGVSNKNRLNLITCDGIWDKQAMSYDKRLVVFTELVVGT